MVKFERAGESGNIFWILAMASEELKLKGEANKVREMIERVIDSGSYENALRIVGEYVELLEKIV